MSNDVEFDRADVLALLAGKTNRFGPAKIVVWYEPQELEISMQVSNDGQFTVYSGGSNYQYAEASQQLPEAEEHLKLLQDAAFHVLPDLKLLHNQDFKWTSSLRDKFRTDARDSLKDVLDHL